MTTKIKRYIFRFTISGLFFALIMWAMDINEGKAFDIGKFLFRIVIFGVLMTLAQVIIDGMWGKKKNAS